ncbi:MAG: hypothetical protein P8M72_10630 [Gammaproteobacteria bacterium]|nr:hypothetical protein [Gammaproteobacteria bacterium]
MIKKYVPYIAWFLAIAAELPAAVAQDLNLFQATDNPEERQSDTRSPQQRRASSNSEPAFTLVGTSRFGDKYYASLLSRNNEQVSIEWTPGRVGPIEGYNGFAIAQINSRSASIRHSDSVPCIDSADKGVRCNGNIAVLTLSNAKPMSPSTRQLEPESVADENLTAIAQTNEEGEPTTIGNTGVLTRNPFSGELQEAPNLSAEEISAREERRQQRAEQFRNFEIVRIPDDEIPQGMQRVRTPFGDRLEPDEN